MNSDSFNDLEHVLLTTMDKHIQSIGNVQSKIPCIFEQQILHESSTKRNNQAYKVVAGEELNQKATNYNINTAYPSEKIDGTCCHVKEYKGVAWLWARHDRKPNKNADKRFKKYQATHRQWLLNGQKGAEALFEWKPEADFKDVPLEWIPATDVPLKDGVPQPDIHGHIPGWIPIDINSRQHCWHQSAWDPMTGVLLILQTKCQYLPSPAGDDLEGSKTSPILLELKARPITDFIGSTLEMIGTMVNANPYHLGDSNLPIHMFVPHGTIPFEKRPPCLFNELKTWFEESNEGKVEGIVWNCCNKNLFKIHRHHLELMWPIQKPKLCCYPVEVNVVAGTSEKQLFRYFSTLTMKTIDSIEKLHDK